MGPVVTLTGRLPRGETGEFPVTVLGVKEGRWSAIELGVEDAAEIKRWLPATQVVMVGDHVTALPEETMNACPVDNVVTGGDYDFLLKNLVEHLEKGRKLEPGIWSRLKNSGKFRLDHDFSSNVPKLVVMLLHLLRPSATPYQQNHQRIAQPGDFPEDRSDKCKRNGNDGGYRLCQNTISQSTRILLGNFG